MIRIVIGTLTPILFIEIPSFYPPSPREWKRHSGRPATVPADKWRGAKRNGGGVIDGGGV